MFYAWLPYFVIPAKAGIQLKLIGLFCWIPAFAGMTDKGTAGLKK